ncbi:MAG: hypothetical protein CMJ49_06900, partial [Planctomycetaceae bacterium]|nr:hypothetical protein [Planctomycetaceae bacterium]
MSRRRRLFRRRRQTSPRTKRADRRPLTKPARRLELEYLEPRILLTTLFGGETFTFRAANPSGDDASAPLAQVILSGDIIVELIGADVDDLNRPLFGDLAGKIIGDSLGRDGTDIGGGIGAVDGVDPVTGDFALGAPMDVFDVDRFGNRVLFYDVPIDDGNVMFNAIATRDALAGGQTYGINTSAVQESESRNLHLVEIEATTGQGDIRAMLQRATLAEDFMSSLRDGGGSVLLDDVRALAVDRSDLVGTAYIVNVEGGTNDSVLYSVNRQVGTTTALGTITNTTSGLPVSNINAMAFNAAGELVLLTDDLDGFGGANDPGFINLGDPKLGGFDTDFTNAETVVVTIP